MKESSINALGIPSGEHIPKANFLSATSSYLRGFTSGFLSTSLLGSGLLYNCLIPSQAFTF